MNDQPFKSVTLDMLRADSSFLYFILESHEGLCFYSTLPFKKGDLNRQVILNYTQGMAKEMENLLGHIKKYIQYEIIDSL